MGVSTALWTGITGLSAHGEKMTVIGNNIANTSTIGFKAQRMHFEDLIYQERPTAAGQGQIGRGVGIGAIMTDFSQGAFETTNESTDLAVGGNGFFMVTPQGTDEEFYTRAGNFRFDKNGYLTDPHGYTLQGWNVESLGGFDAQRTGAAGQIQRVGAVGDIRLETFNALPEPTGYTKVINNLDAEEASKTTAVDPVASGLPYASNTKFFGLHDTWDGTADPPLDSGAYAFQTTLKVFDESGKDHELTVYFDQVDVSADPGANAQKVWEYIVTCKPEEDLRLINGDTTSLASTHAGGLLMSGTMTFTAAGELANMSAYTLRTDVATVDAAHTIGNWEAAEFSTNGFPLFAVNFLGKTGASLADSTNAVDAQLVELDLGITSNTNSWATAGAPGAMGAAGAAFADLNTMAGAEPLANSTTSFASASANIALSQDGYPSGNLMNIEVDRDGVLTGRYSNGQILPLYQLALFDFQNRWGLRREGGNLYSETRASGEQLMAPPNERGMGSIAANTLEQSNVDLATEFVQMITTEKGFQANGKVITTSDMMLQTVIGLKRP